MARLTPFELGQIKAHSEHGLSTRAIADRIVKSDGEAPSKEAVTKALKKMKRQPDWRGERQNGSGAPRKTSTALDKRLVSEVLKKRGKKKMTSTSLKRKFTQSCRTLCFSNSELLSRTDFSNF